jgi:hypothetical protein
MSAQKTEPRNTEGLGGFREPSVGEDLTSASMHACRAFEHEDKASIETEEDKEIQQNDV